MYGEKRLRFWNPQENESSRVVIIQKIPIFNYSIDVEKISVIRNARDLIGGKNLGRTLHDVIPNFFIGVFLSRIYYEVFGILFPGNVIGLRSENRNMSNCGI